MMEAKNNVSLENLLVGEKIKALLDFHKVKQVDLAKSINISPFRLSNYIHNKRNIPIDVLQRIAKFFDLELEFFISTTKNNNIRNNANSMINISLEDLSKIIKQENDDFIDRLNKRMRKFN